MRQACLAALALLAACGPNPNQPVPHIAITTPTTQHVNTLPDITRSPTTTHPPRASRSAARPRTATLPARPGPAATTDIWRRLAMCESGMRNDGGAPYYGYWQFSASTWRSVGGPGLPNEHDYATQLHYAQALQARSGWGQWPVCSRKLGLR